MEVGQETSVYLDGIKIVYNKLNLSIRYMQSTVLQCDLPQIDFFEQQSHKQVTKSDCA